MKIKKKNILAIGFGIGLAMARVSEANSNINNITSKMEIGKEIKYDIKKANL